MLLAGGSEEEPTFISESEGQLGGGGGLAIIDLPLGRLQAYSSVGSVCSIPGVIMLNPLCIIPQSGGRLCPFGKKDV